MKTITICGKEHKLECNALTYVKYKNFFKRGIIEDVQILQDYLIKQTIITKQVEEKNITEVEKLLIVSNYMNKYIDDFIIAITRIAWILMYTADKDIEEYEKWLEGISSFKIDDDWIDDWIVEVAEFAVSCFC